MKQPDEPSIATETSTQREACDPVSVPWGDRINQMFRSIIGPRIHSQMRARKLAQRLGLAVTIGHSDWLRGEFAIAVLLRRESDGSIHPTGVRMTPDVPDLVLVGRNGVRARCKQYNARIHQLYELADRVTKIVRRAGAPQPGSPLAYAHLELTRVPALIAYRQANTMGQGVIPLEALVREIEWFGRCDAHLGPIVHSAEVANRHAKRKRSTS